MCDPVTIGFIALSAAGAYQASETRSEVAGYQSQVAANNAKVSEWQAEDAKARGDEAANQLRRKYAGLQGTQRATMAARGLDLTEGSANAILTDTDFFGQYDQNIARDNAGREAWGHRVQAGNFRGDAAAFRAQADAENPLLSAAMGGAGAYLAAGGGSLLSSGTQVNPRWYGVNRSAGMPSISNMG